MAPAPRADRPDRLDRPARGPLATAAVLALGLLALVPASSPRAAAQDAGRSEPEQQGPTPEETEAAVKLLEEGLKSKEPAERVAALRAAASVPADPVAKAVAPALKDKHADVAVAAMEVLGEMQAPDALKELHRHAKGDKSLPKDARLYATILKAIGRHGDASSVEVLSDNPWSNTDATVVRARIYGLGNIRDLKAVEALLEMMNKGKPLPGEEAPFAPDFRVALARLTGTDQTENKSMWQSWWNENKKGFKVAEQAAPLPGELQARWDDYWGAAPAPAPASEPTSEPEKSSR
jgi:HEAT repeat protein